MPPKVETFSFTQVRELMKLHEETIMNFFNGAIERMEKKITTLVEENVLVKKELADLKESVQFHSDMVEEKTKQVERQIIDYKENTVIPQVDSKEMDKRLAELEDRSRRNNLRFDGLLEDEKETWKDSENKVKHILQNELDFNPDEVIIERAHRSGKIFRDDGGRNWKRTIVVRFLNYKDKDQVLAKFRDKKLWNRDIFVNEDFSDYTLEVRKELFKKAKVARERGLYAKVVYNKLITHKFKETREE